MALLSFQELNVPYPLARTAQKQTNDRNEMNGKKRAKTAWITVSWNGHSDSIYIFGLALSPFSFEPRILVNDATYLSKKKNIRKINMFLALFDVEKKRCAKCLHTKFKVADYLMSPRTENEFHIFHTDSSNFSVLTTSICRFSSKPEFRKQPERIKRVLNFLLLLYLNGVCESECMVCNSVGLCRVPIYPTDLKFIWPTMNTGKQHTHTYIRLRHEDKRA